MDYSHDKSWDKFQEVLESKDTIQKNWEALIKYHIEFKPKEFWKDVLAIDLELDQNEILSWIEDIVKERPVPEHVKGIWFGIAKLWDEDNEKEFYALYFNGADSYNTEDIEWATEPTFEPNPEVGYFIPAGLNELNDLMEGDEDYSFLDWILPLAYSSIIVNDIVKNKINKELFKNTKDLGVTIGYDSGDFQALASL